MNEPVIIERNGVTCTLHHCDCMDLMRDLPDKAFDLAIVDVPYGIGMDGTGMPSNSATVTQNNGSRLIVQRNNYTGKPWDNCSPSRDYFSELFRVSKNQIIWGANHFIDKIPIPSPCWIVWDKVNGGTNQSDCELAWTSFQTAVRQYEFMWSGMCQGNPSNGRLMQGNKALNEKRIHPTQKPVALYSWLLANYAKPGHAILDTHLGSGSIAIACLNHGFNLTACELDADYFQAATERIQREANQGVLI